jgi:hypothetical protein
MVIKRRKSSRKAQVLVKTEEGLIVTLQDYCRKARLSVQRIIQRLKAQRDNVSTLILDYDSPVLTVGRMSKGALIGVSDCGDTGLYFNEIDARNAGATTLIKRIQNKFLKLDIAANSKWVEVECSEKLNSLPTL